MLEKWETHLSGNILIVSPIHSDTELGKGFYEVKDVIVPFYTKPNCMYPSIGEQIPKELLLKQLELTEEEKVKYL